jgi:putative saccharopine dehydrogenase
VKIVLVNANPAVSRLATLALSKMGYEYVEIGDVGELSGVFDVLILDSDIDVKETNLKEFANKILYLSSKNSPTFEYADRILPKPFLPTEFITIVEDLASKTKSAEQPAATNNNETAEVSVEGFEFIDDPAEDVFEDEIMELDPGEFKLDDEFEDDLQGVPVKDSAFDELNEIVKAIDDMDELSEKLGDEELDLDGADDEATEFDEFEIAAKDDKFDDFSADLDMPDELMDIKFETADEPELGATELVADGEDKHEETQDKFELDFDGSIEDIKHQIDEIDKMDELSENLDTGDEPLDAKFETADELDADEFVDMDGADEQEALQSLEQAKDDDKFAIEETEEQEDIFADMDMKFDEPDEQEVQVKNSALGDEFLLDDMDVAGEENLAQDILDNELADDIFAVEEQGETEISSEQEEQEIGEPEAMQNESEIAQQIDPSEYGDIEQISEKDMALALDEMGFDGGEAVNPSSQKAQTTSKINELKAQISDTVAKNLENSLQDGELREALKNLNIKINISFEEK